jgi:hypothetical protein
MMIFNAKYIKTNFDIDDNLFNIKPKYDNSPWLKVLYWMSIYWWMIKFDMCAIKWE